MMKRNRINERQEILLEIENHKTALKRQVDYGVKNLQEKTKTLGTGALGLVMVMGAYSLMNLFKSWTGTSDKEEESHENANKPANQWDIVSNTLFDRFKKIIAEFLLNLAKKELLKIISGLRNEGVTGDPE